MVLRNATPKPLLALFFAAAGLCAAPSYAQTDAQLMASGQWRDPATGLIWMRCSIGQKWTGSTCSGTPITLNWQDANDYFQIFNQNGFAGNTNWRLPKIEELVTLRRCSNGWAHEVVTESRLTAEGRRDFKVDQGIQKITLSNDTDVPQFCANNSSRPTLNTTVFPNTPDLWYWSASPNAGNNYGAWGVFFNDGGTGSSNKDGNNYVRAVRAGQ
jgi:hypothetical protein